MKFVAISAIVVALAASALGQSEIIQQQAGSGLQIERQARSMASSSKANMIDQKPAGKVPRIDIEKRKVHEFMTPKNLVKSIVKLIFGSPQEMSATSRNVISVIGSMLQIMKGSFAPKSRQGVARTSRDSVQDAASAGISIVQGYIQSILAGDNGCVQSILCQTSKDAIQESPELGFLIAKVGNYATSYMLENEKNTFKSLYEASTKPFEELHKAGRSVNCSELCQSNSSATTNAI